MFVVVSVWGTVVSVEQRKVCCYLAVDSDWSQASLSANVYVDIVSMAS